MFLHALDLRNFRAIRTGRVTFEKNTLLLGENHSGRTSVLEALSLALDEGLGSAPPEFRPWHFHRSADGEPADRARIEVRFRERTRGEWSAPRYAPLEALTGPSSRRRTVVLAFWADAREHPGESVVADWMLFPENRPDRGSDDPELLEWVRRSSPLYWIRAGSISGMPGHRVPTASAELSEERRAVVDELRDHHRRLVQRTSTDGPHDLDAGFEAARTLLAQAARIFSGDESPLRSTVSEILSHRTGRPTEYRVPDMEGHGSSAARIGVLLLTVALLEAKTGMLAEGAEPILIVEDPEANLHPTTLAAVMRVLNRVRWQRIVTTQSGPVVTATPLRSVRRLTREHGRLREWRVRPGKLTADEMRRVTYHLRARHSAACFARVWLLVEGESEYWMLPEIARCSGYDLRLEGIDVVEFAQCGLPPLIKLAIELGIEWHVLTDGDNAGNQYVAATSPFVRSGDLDRRVTRMPARDIEHLFWDAGYESVFAAEAGVPESVAMRSGANSVIRKALKRRSKPWMALTLVEAMAQKDSPGVPPMLRRMVETLAEIAREAPPDGR